MRDKHMGCQMARCAAVERRPLLEGLQNPATRRVRFGKVVKADELLQVIPGAADKPLDAHGFPRFHLVRAVKMAAFNAVYCSRRAKPTLPGAACEL